MLESILHVSIIVKNTQVALQFYCDILKCEINQDRPDLGFPGAWLNIGKLEIHILEVPNPDPIDNRPKHGGRDRHIAFSTIDLDQLTKQLSTYKIPFTESKSGRKAVFFRDPDGNTLEVIQQ